jgi:hypothetical protein
MLLPMQFVVTLLAGCAASGSSMTPATSPTISAEVTPNLASPSSETSAAVRGIKPTSGDTVDGFKIGVIVACSPGVGQDAAELDRGCAGFPRRATAALDASEPNHPAVVGVATYSDGTQPEPVDYSRQDHDADGTDRRRALHSEPMIRLTEGVHGG